MDRRRFDELARLLGTTGSRRTTLGALLGGAFAGTALEADAKNRNKNKHKNKNKRKRRKQNQQQTCFGTNVCQFPSNGQSFRECNLAGTDLDDCDGCDFRRADLGNTGFTGSSFQGSSFREANLKNADLRGADLTGASFRDACLVGANLSDAETDGASFRGAIFCNTFNPDGSINNSDCDKTDACCQPDCTSDANCSAGAPTCCNGRCVNTTNDPFNCGGCLATCFTNEICVNGACQVECVKDTDCPGDEFCCSNVCTAQCCEDSQCPSGNCENGQCVGQICLKPTDCPDDETCCAGFCCSPNCDCVDRVPGPGVACISDDGGCNFPCSNDAECQTSNPGWICVDDGFCDFTHCHPPCGFDGAANRSGRRRRGH